MDGDGIPLSFDITPGSQNEQNTLQPLEKKIIKDFNNPQIIVCTDVGLASTTNRKFITTQSLKKLKEFLTEWA